jgi:hypothetical protein
MMPRWMKILAAVLALLLAVYLTLKIPRGRRPDVPAAPAAPAKIEIKAPAGTVTLRKDSGVWRVVSPADWPADPEKAREFAASLGEISAETTLTHRAETHGLYGLSESSGIAVAVQGEDGASAEWIFGKSANFSRIYLRLPGRPQVFLARGPRRDVLERAAEEWRDRRVLALAGGETVEEVRLRLGAAESELKRSSAAWESGGKQVFAQAAESFLDALRALSAEDFADAPGDPRTLGLDKPEASAAVRLSSGRSIAFDVGRADAGTGLRPVKRAGEDAVLLASEHEWEAVRKRWNAALGTGGR